MLFAFFFWAWKSNWISDNCDSMTLPRFPLLRSTYIAFQRWHFRVRGLESDLLSQNTSAQNFHTNGAAIFSGSEPFARGCLTLLWIHFSPSACITDPFWWAGNLSSCCDLTDLNYIPAIENLKYLRTLREPLSIVLLSFLKVFVASENTKWL